MRPTNPRSVPSGAARRETRRRPPSSPLRPIADCPWRFRRRTMSLLTLPTSTILATSTVAASLTRRPPTNSTGRSRRSMYAVISGPPPCTTTGSSPTYFRSTTSRAKSSRRPGSSIAAPPYLMTIVRPWNSRMYGSASRRASTSRTAGPLGRVLGVDGDVRVREVGEEDLRLVPVAGQADDVLDLGAGDLRGERLGVVRHRRPARAHLDALDRDVERHRRRVDEGHAGGLGDPAPVRVAAVQRGLHER